jgi:hypothetical protein
LRKRRDAIRDQKELQGSKNDLEKEFNIIKSRLESLDPAYERENKLFTRIVDTLRKGSINVMGAFEHFDQNKDGILDRGEFERAISQMGMSLSHNDVNSLIKAIDIDGDNKIQYREFERKLKRCGLRSLTKQEHLMHNIVKGLKETAKKAHDLFGFINKDGSGFASR